MRSDPTERGELCALVAVVAAVSMAARGAGPVLFGGLDVRLGAGAVRGPAAEGAAVTRRRDGDLEEARAQQSDALVRLRRLNPLLSPL